MEKKAMIDKSAAMEQLRAIEQNGKITDAQKFKQAKFVVENAPTIEAEPVRHGRWEKSPTGNENYKYCSECGGCFYMQSSKVIYCPYCGARMDGGTENG